MEIFKETKIIVKEESVFVMMKGKENKRNLFKIVFVYGNMELNIAWRKAAAVVVGTLCFYHFKRFMWISILGGNVGGW